MLIKLVRIGCALVGVLILLWVVPPLARSIAAGSPGHPLPGIAQELARTPLALKAAVRAASPHHEEPQVAATRAVNLDSFVFVPAYLLLLAALSVVLSRTIDRRWRSLAIVLLVLALVAAAADLLENHWLRQAIEAVFAPPPATAFATDHVTAALIKWGALALYLVLSGAFFWRHRPTRWLGALSILAGVLMATGLAPGVGWPLLDWSFALMGLTLVLLAWPIGRIPHSPSPQLTHSPSRTSERRLRARLPRLRRRALDHLRWPGDGGPDDRRPAARARCRRRRAAGRAPLRPRSPGTPTSGSATPCAVWPSRSAGRRTTTASLSPTTSVSSRSRRRANLPPPGGPRRRKDSSGNGPAAGSRPSPSPVPWQYRRFPAGAPLLHAPPPASHRLGVYDPAAPRLLGRLRCRAGLPWAASATGRFGFLTGFSPLSHPLLAEASPRRNENCETTRGKGGGATYCHLSIADNYRIP